MDLAGLTAYAREKYNIREQHKWADFPGFSVLVDPDTGKWAALLMRQWDSDLGEQIERCDIKCGRSCLEQYRVPWLSGPFRMHGQKWVGVSFDEGTDPEIVCGLLDRALEKPGNLSREGPGSSSLYVLGRDFEPWKKREADTSPVYTGKRYYQDSLIPGFDGNGDSRLPAREGSGDNGFSAREGSGDNGYSSRESSRDSGLAAREDERLPAQIRGMKRLYKYRDGTFRDRSMNFYIQGKFMEDYEDNVPWRGDFRRYFPTYHDLRDDQLRGYFTWRAGIRKGIFEEVPPSVVYIYIYELLNGIGASSPEESLRKLREFEEGYLGPAQTENRESEAGGTGPEKAGPGKAGFEKAESGKAGSGITGFRETGFGKSRGKAGFYTEKGEIDAIRKNLHRWMLEFAVTHGVDPETACLYADPETMQRDCVLEILREPRRFEDQEVFDALCYFSGNKTASSPAVKNTADGIHLFAETWRYACAHSDKEDGDLFRYCFGDRKTKAWFPLENLMYGAKRPSEPVSYILNPCRTYTFDGKFWRETSYQKISFDKKRLTGFLHETERQLRLYLKAGGRLKEMSDEAWAAPYVQAVIEADRTAKIEAARPKIHIRFSDLDQIRQDALETRDSLLTEEERQENAIMTAGAVRIPDIFSSDPEMNTQKDIDSEITGKGSPQEESFSAEEKVFSETDHPADIKSGQPPHSPALFPDEAPALPLDKDQRELLLALLRGESVRERIAARHGMPEIVADALNEALFDEIGDSVVECDGDEIVLVEEYREDILELLHTDMEMTF